MAGILRQTMNSLSRRLWATDTPYGGTNTFVVVDDANLTALTAAGPYGTAWTTGSGTGAIAVCGGLAGFMAPRDAPVTAVYYSADGIGWTARSFPTARSWKGIATNNSRFVAIASATNKAPYSDDKGVTWTEGTLPATSNWSAITCNKATGTWIAIANGSSTIARSTDGATWTSVSAPSASAWNCITSTNTKGGRFVALATGSSAVMYSTDDGLTWQSSSGLSAQNYKIAYGNGLFVSASRNAGAYATSPDGITWTNRTPPAFTGGPSCVGFGNGRFIMASFNQGACYYSTDGINWTAGATLPNFSGVQGQWIDIAFA